MNDSIYISIASALIALFALLRTFKKDRENAIHNQKALIRAKGYEMLSVKSWKVKIWNDGESTATNIRFISKDLEKPDSGIYLQIYKGIFPYPILNKGDSFEIPASLSEGYNPVPIIKFIWDDEYRKNNEREQVLEF